MHDSNCAVQEQAPEYYDEIEETIDEALGNHFEERYETVEELDIAESVDEEASKACPTPPELEERGFWDCTNDEYRHKAMCQLNCNKGFHPVGIRLSRVSFFLIFNLIFLRFFFLPEIQMYLQ